MPPTLKTPAAFVTPDFFVLRTPLLPVDELLAFGADLQAPGVDPAHLPQALAADRATLRGRLQALLKRPEVREAIFLASPSLEESVDHWTQHPESERAARTERSLVRYFARMAGRPTPFGLFAGYSLGQVGAETRLELAGRAAYQRHTRLDEGYLATLGERLAAAAPLAQQVEHRVNTSLYQVAGRLCYVRALPSGGSRHFAAISEEAPAPAQALRATLDLLALGGAGRRAAELSAALVASGALPTLAEAEAYVRELIQRQILVPDLAPPVTGEEPLPGLAAQLARTPGGEEAAAWLREAGAALTALDGAGLGASPRSYRDLAGSLAALPVPPDLAHLFYVDLRKPAPAATLGADVLGEIAAGAALLQRIGGGGGADELAQFRDAFRRRYEDREVPLSTALDEQAGVAFAAPGAPGAEPLPLLSDLPFTSCAGAGGAAAWGRREGLLLRKLEEALRSGAQEVALQDEDLAELEDPQAPPLPDAFAVTATVVAAPDGLRVHLDSAAGPSGASRLGRFCHGDGALRARVERHLRAEEALRPEALFAEVVHLPEGPMGTVISRPRLRAFEIPYAARSGADVGHQLALADLRVSVRDDRVVLRSARLGREVIPRLTTPHNHGNGRNLRLYRFLGALQAQGTQRAVSFSWGALEGAAFLPRLTCGRLILSLARWNLRPAQWRAVVEGEGAARFAALQALRRALGLPRWVALVDKDNLLPLDLDNVLSIESVTPLLKDRAQATLVEVLYGDAGSGAPCARGPEGGYAHQVVVPLVRARSVLAAAKVAPPSPVRGPRSFAPGSEWLYAKLYTDRLSADAVLLRGVGPVLERALRSGSAQGWFFIRYGDPDWHLRLRVRGEPRRLLGEVLPALHQALAPLAAEGAVGRVQLDTYEREVERYGGDAGVGLSERLFQADSEAALAVLAALRGAADADNDRWRCALWGMDRLLDDLGLDLPSKAAVIGLARERFAEEFGVDAAFQRELGARFRRERPILEALRGGRAPLPAAVATAFERRSQRVAPVAAELRDAAAQGRLGTLVEALAVSYVHMHANRLLRSAARPQELVLYDFLDRLYESEAARARRPGTAALNLDNGARRL